jgi:hypothetical protein
MDNASIGAMTAVLIDGTDATRVLNSMTVDKPVDAVDNTRFRPPGYAREFIQGLGSATLRLGGFLPFEFDTVLALMENSNLDKRTGQEILAGVGGLDVGHLAVMAKSIQTTSSNPISPDGIVTSSAEFVNGKGGVRLGHVLLGLHGAQVAGANEIQVLTITAMGDGEAITLGDGDGGTVSVTDLFTSTNGTTVTAAEIRAKLESMPGIGANNVYVTGSAAFTTTWDGSFRVMFTKALAGLNVPPLTSNNADVVVTTDTIGGGKYNVLTAVGNQTAVRNYDVATPYGGEAMLQVISAVGSGKTMTVKVQHAPDIGDAPGTFTDLITFDAVTAGRTVLREALPANTAVNPWLRARVSAITGSFVASVGFGRNYS